MAPLQIIIAGAPASGKGTQCELIVQKYGVVHISTGDALREQVTAGTPLGVKAKEFMDQGALVPDDLIINIVKDRLAQDDCQQRGWLLDGFPRTGVQAEALKAADISPTHFVLLDVPDSILVERCVGRRSDPVTGKIYHLKFNPPPDDPEVIARLVHRSDDTEEAMGKRINMYHQNVDAVIGFYQDISKNFDGTADKHAIAAEIGYFLEGRSRPLQIIIAGAPASGKGTQCELIVEKFGVVHISTGDALREQVKAGTPLGMQAKECMDQGALVPDELIISIVKERLAQDDCRERGWLLDGFPRTGPQAEALKAADIRPSHFVLLDVPDSILVERCVGRRSDPVTGKIYHLTFNPPPADDPEVAARLVQRSDDTAEAMGKRINMYHQNVDAVIGFYSDISRTFDGTADKHSIASEVADFLSGKLPPSAAAAAAASVSGPTPGSRGSAGGGAGGGQSTPSAGPLRVIIAGPPASGKGTQCEMIVERYGLVHISTGDALREEVGRGTELGARAKECMDAGALVPDELITNIVRARLAQEDCAARGWLLDGFPRTGPQAEALISAGIAATHFVILDVPDGILVDRCVGRRSDPVTGKIYHLKFNPPPANDPAVAARLVQRSDDTAEAMGKRIRMYHQNVDAVAGFYSEISKKFDGTADKHVIAERVAAFLERQRAAGAAAGGDQGPQPGGLRIIIAGPPASGKGTQCEGIVREFGVVHVSTGDELREHVRQDSDLGRVAKGYMDAGGLVPDEIMVKIVRARLAHQDCVERGWLLDGFPRTGPQVLALKEAGIEPERFILLDVPDDVLIDRCVGRRSDPVTGKIYHLTFNPPPADDPAVAARLVQRSDDTAEAMGKRIATYHHNLSAVVGYYHHLARRVNGYRDKDAVSADIAGFIRGEYPPDMSGAAPRRPLPTPEAAAAYVQERLQPLLVDGLKAVAKAKPERPLMFLARWLLENNPNRPAAESVPSRVVGVGGGKLVTRQEKE